jgi:hypothetical protein
LQIDRRQQLLGLRQFGQEGMSRFARQAGADDAGLKLD